jgi:radical SAM protein with 4Fe4S-binding SPASM domain
LCISEFGEISLLKSSRQLFDALAERGWRNIQFVTNATATNMGFFEYLFEYNIDSKVIISLESADPVLFKTIRGFSFRRYKRCIDNINALREKYCAKAELVISACCMKKNILHLPGIVEFAADNGFSHVGFVPLVVNEGVHAPDKLNVTQQTLDNIDIHLKTRVYAETLAMAERKKIQVCLPEAAGPENKFGNDSWTSRNDQFVCTLPYDFVSVSKEGNIYPCCKMRRDCSLGNIFEHSFADIWDGPGYARLFKSLRQEGTLLKNCRSCTVPQGYAW